MHAQSTGTSRYPVAGAGLGFRRALVPELRASGAAGIDFFELAPENWIHAGGALAKDLRHFTERHPFVAHGLSLSLGGPAPLDFELLGEVGRFLDSHGIRAYTEHLSYCSDDGHLYDLMPIPFTEEAVRWVAGRIRQAQETLARPIAVENVSYYAAPGARMSEIEFVNAVLAEADCGLLLDVNNVYVNSINHRYDARQFLRALPARRVCYFHVAGHFVEAPDLRVDTHGAAVSDAVWSLLDEAYARFGPVPTLLERDFNIPPLAELVAEVAAVRERQARRATRRATG
ncbi:MAG: HvfB family MNIO-type RiPP peptide maturase [Gammaproteobacteria bacterium]